MRHSSDGIALDGRNFGLAFGNNDFVELDFTHGCVDRCRKDPK